MRRLPKVYGPVLEVPLGLVMKVCALINPNPPQLAPGPSGVSILWLDISLTLCSVLEYFIM